MRLLSDIYWSLKYTKTPKESLLHCTNNKSSSFFLFESPPELAPTERVGFCMDRIRAYGNR